MGEVKKQIGEMSKEIQTKADKIQELETLTIDVDKRVEDLVEENKRLEIVLETKTEK